jgi:transcriptional regulator EpsA
MTKLVMLNAQDMEHLLVTLETSLAIRNRPQFYLWAQGALQGFLPHETLVCAHGDIAQMRFKCLTFTGGASQTAGDGADVDAAVELMPRIVDDWLRAGRLPRLFGGELEAQVGRHQLLADLKRRGFERVVAHGAREIAGSHGSFFLFLRMRHAPGARDAYLLELLMPYMYMALQRTLAAERGDPSGAASPVTLLSKREIQVLHWVKHGKTNQEIGKILDISAPTVKNHLQKVMRKLNVTNRAQAVGKSAALRLIAPGDQN